MQRLLFTLSLLTLPLFAYSDFDLDGVDDAVDRCPNTPLTELVDIYGCTTKNLEGDHHFDIIAGLSLSQFNENTLNALDPNDTDTVTTTLQADYYYKNFSLQASTSYFNSQSQSYSDSGQNDSFIGAYYQFNPFTSLNLQLGGGLRGSRPAPNARRPLPRGKRPAPGLVPVRAVDRGRHPRRRRDGCLLPSDQALGVHRHRGAAGQRLGATAGRTQDQPAQ